MGEDAKYVVRLEADERARLQAFVDEVRGAKSVRQRVLLKADQAEGLPHGSTGGWSTPRIEELRITPDRCLLARVDGETGFKAFLGAEADLIRNISGLSAVAELDGDEIGYLLGKVAELKRIE